jgi:hypothetical protein
MKEYGINVNKVPICVEIDSSEEFGSWSAGYTPCITASRGKSRGFFITVHGRRIRVNEMMRCQGMQPKRLRKWTESMSRGAIGHAIGNAMSVCVLERLLPTVLYSAGILARRPVDNHADSAFKPRFLD